MTKDELIKALHDCRDNMDTETGHAKADDLLVEYINDPDIQEAYDAIGKWYA